MSCARVLSWHLLIEAIKGTDVFCSFACLSKLMLPTQPQAAVTKTAVEAAASVKCNNGPDTNVDAHVQVHARTDAKAAAAITLKAGVTSANASGEASVDVAATADTQVDDFEAELEKGDHRSLLEGGA